MTPWQQELKRNFTDIETLADFLNLDMENRKALLEKPRFILNLPHRLARKIEKNNIDDPIFKQFVPTVHETQSSLGFSQDPTEEKAFRQEKKLLHKYTSRALIVTTSSCAMHCRYCFRQNFPYETEQKDFANELRYLQRHQEIEEVILSGGDPLSLPDYKLEALVQEIEKIPHVKRLRFHTRFLIGIPERITQQLCDLLEKCSLQVWFVLHVNHPAELDQDVIDAIQKIAKLGIPVLNQSALLKGVNDSFEVHKELCISLSNIGVIPYYLNQLDPVEGAQHFEVSDQKGLELITKLREEVSGYAVPQFVKEVPFEKSKQPVDQLHLIDSLQT